MAAALVNAGKDVLLPLYGAHCRYDLVFEDEEGFHRVQCKTGRVLGNIVHFITTSRTKNEHRDYRDDVEFFGVCCLQRQETYLVPVDDVPLWAASLRLHPTRNGQTKGIRWASDYLLG